VRNLEINSDKYTVLMICMALIFVFLGAARSVEDLITRRMRPRDNGWLDYFVIAFLFYVLLTAIRDHKLRKAHPLGIAAVGFLFVAYGLRMLSPDGIELWWRLPGLLELTSCSLLIFEIARWFRKRLRIAKSG